MNLNRGQILSIVIAVLGVLVASTSQLTDLFGPSVTKTLVSAASMVMAMLGVINSTLQGAGSQIQAVKDMGVQQLVVGKDASSILAKMAVSADENKVSIAPGAEKAVQATASL